MSGAPEREVDVAALTRVAERVRPTTLAREQRLALHPALEPLAPVGGLRRGSTLSVDGPAAVSLALAAAAQASRDGAWVATVGFPSLGLLAAAELGVALERLVLVAEPDPGDADVWPAAVAALLDAFDVVLVQASGRVRARDGRRLVARARERGAVLIQVGGERPATAAWPEGADVTWRVTASSWHGLGDGYGHLEARRVTVVGGGRREAARPRRTELWLPSAAGQIEMAVPDPVPFPGRGTR